MIRINIIFLLLYVLLFQFSIAQLISEAKIEKCLNSGDPSAMQCENKMIIVIATSKGKVVETQVLNSVSGKDGKSVNFDGDVTITVSQPKNPRYIFPLLSTQTKVNFCPREVMRYVTDLPFISLCQAGLNDVKPTCDWVYNENGAKIPYSQGFCCKCNGIFSGENARSGSSCGIFDFSSSAHCMKPSEVWYSVNNILPGNLDLEINIELKQGDKSGTITLTPSHPQIFLEKNIHNPFTVQATILGQLATSYQPPNLESNYALIPIEPSENTFVQQRNLYTALVPKSFVSLTGDECDKIGVSYITFYSQSSRCSVVPTTCLRNQICDLLDSDFKRVNAGNRALYFIGADQNTKISSQNGKEYLEYPITEGTQNTLITLEVDAGDLRVISNVSPGKIIDVVVHTFESLGGSGEIEVLIENSGTLRTSKILTATCSEDIHNVVAKQFLIEAKSIMTQTLEIHTKSSAGQNHTCTIQLINEQSQIEDTTTITFNTSETVVKTPEENEEERRKEVETEDGKGGFDFGSFDFGGSISSLFEGLLNSPILVGGILLVATVIIVVIVVVLSALICYCCISTNSFPLFMSLCCTLTRSTNSAMTIVGSSNLKIANKLRASSKKNRNHSSQKYGVSESSSFSDSDISIKRSKWAPSKKRSRTTEKSSSSTTSRNKKKHHKGMLSPPRRCIRRHAHSAHPSNSQKSLPNLRQKRIQRLQKQKLSTEHCTAPTPSVFPTPRRLPPPPPIQTTDTSEVAISLNPLPMPQIKKKKPIFDYFIPPPSMDAITTWCSDNQLVYWSFDYSSQVYKKYMSNFIDCGDSPENASFSICGFLVNRNGRTFIELRNYTRQLFEVANNDLIISNPRRTLPNRPLFVPGDAMHLHTEKVLGPVLNMGYEGNYILWDQMIACSSSLTTQ